MQRNFPDLRARDECRVDATDSIPWRDRCFDMIGILGILISFALMPGMANAVPAAASDLSQQSQATPMHTPATRSFANVADAKEPWNAYVSACPGNDLCSNGVGANAGPSDIAAAVKLQKLILAIDDVLHLFSPKGRNSNLEVASDLEDTPDQKDNSAQRQAQDAWDQKQSISISPIPEPQTYVMMMTGLCLLSLVGRRRNKRNSTAPYAA